MHTSIDSWGSSLDSTEEFHSIPPDPQKLDLWGVEGKGRRRAGREGGVSHVDVRVQPTDPT